MSEKLWSEHNHLIATIDPAFNNSTLASDAWDMSKYRQVAAILMTGAATTSATVDAKIQFSATSNGTFTTGVSGKTITQLTDADGDKQVIINLSAAEAASTAKKWARVLVTNSTTNYNALVVFGTHSRFKEPWTTISYGDLSSVDEILK